MLVLMNLITLKRPHTTMMEDHASRNAQTTILLQPLVIKNTARRLKPPPAPKVKSFQEKENVSKIAQTMRKKIQIIRNA